jgi:hypothetical protein
VAPRMAVAHHLCAHVDVAAHQPDQTPARSSTRPGDLHLPAQHLRAQGLPPRPRPGRSRCIDAAQPQLLRPMLVVGLTHSVSPSVTRVTTPSSAAHGEAAKARQPATLPHAPAVTGEQPCDNQPSSVRPAATTAPDHPRRLAGALSASARRPPQVPRRG